NYPGDEEVVDTIKGLVKGVRNVRSSMNVSPGRKAEYFIVTADEHLRELFADHQDIYKNLISSSAIKVQADKSGIADDAVSVVIPNAVVYIPLEELVDMQKEKERLTKERDHLAKELARSNGMLKNEKFLAKAPAEKVAAEQEKLAKYQAMMQDVELRLAQIK
ncbi:MAG: valine--tRNA ligase, partial [Clostridiales bacterium]|nr:valine--tRNA ligase [Clostridiales bacterium]